MPVLKIKQNGEWVDVAGGGAGSVDIDLEGANVGNPNPVDADTLGGKPAAAYATESFVANKIAEVGSSEPDLVIGVNVSGQNMVYFTQMGIEDVSIVSGSVSDAVNKVKQGLPVKVIMTDIHYYSTGMWSRGIAEAIYVSLSVQETSFPSDTYDNLSVVFRILHRPGTSFGWDVTPFFDVHIGFDLSTGEVCKFVVK